MYNLDNGKQMIIKGETQLTLLATEKYLQGVPRIPVAEGQMNYRSDEVGNVWCLYHGTIDGQQIESSASVVTGKGTCTEGN